MTAEVVVMNKSGVALAADSKVTITSGYGEKTYDTVNKVFTLSKVHPVGIMIFGSAEFMLYPWETIIKQYRAEKRNKSFATVDAWSDDFLKYVKGFGEIRKVDISTNVHNILSSWLAELTAISLNTARDKNISIPSSSLTSTLLSIIKRHSGYISKSVDLLTPTATKLVMNAHKAEIDDLLKMHLDYFGCGSGLIDAARVFCELALRKAAPSPVASGFVVAGYGDREIFPAFRAFDSDGYVSKIAKIYQNRLTVVTRDMSSCIAAFAQDDMVARFMNGIDEDLSKYLFALCTKSITESCLDVLKRYGKSENNNAKIRTAIRRASIESVRELTRAAAEYSADKFSLPITNMVSLLPKEELPQLAESLVGITSLKRHVSHDAETVGGPIDVALISKNDGFVWIRRKHYFRPELNSQFSINYMRDAT